MSVLLIGAFLLLLLQYPGDVEGCMFTSRATGRSVLIDIKRMCILKFERPSKGPYGLAEIPNVDSSKPVKTWTQRLSRQTAPPSFVMTSPEGDWTHGAESCVQMSVALDAVYNDPLLKPRYGSINPCKFLTVHARVLYEQQTQATTVPTDNTLSTVQLANALDVRAPVNVPWDPTNHFTFSWEMESSNDEFLKYYRPEHLSDAEWANLSEENRKVVHTCLYKRTVANARACLQNPFGADSVKATVKMLATLTDTTVLTFNDYRLCRTCADTVTLTSFWPHITADKLLPDQLEQEVGEGTWEIKHPSFCATLQECFNILYIIDHAFVTSGGIHFHIAFPTARLPWKHFITFASHLNDFGLLTTYSQGKIFDKYNAAWSNRDIADLIHRYNPQRHDTDESGKYYACTETVDSNGHAVSRFKFGPVAYRCGDHMYGNTGIKRNRRAGLEIRYIRPDQQWEFVMKVLAHLLRLPAAVQQPDSVHLDIAVGSPMVPLAIARSFTYSWQSLLNLYADDTRRRTGLTLAEFYDAMHGANKWLKPAISDEQLFAMLRAIYTARVVTADKGLGSGLFACTNEDRMHIPSSMAALRRTKDRDRRDRFTRCYNQIVQRLTLVFASSWDGVIKANDPIHGARARRRAELTVGSVKVGTQNGNGWAIDTTQALTFKQFADAVNQHDWKHGKRRGSKKQPDTRRPIGEIVRPLVEYVSGWLTAHAANDLAPPFFYSF